MHFEKKISRKAGLPPGIPVYIGDAPPHATTLSLLTYSDKEVKKHESLSSDEITPLIHPDDKAWIQITGLDDVRLIEKTLTSYGVHPLIIEDVLNTKGISKIEESDDYLFVVLNYFHCSQEEIFNEQVSLFLTAGVVITCTDTPDIFSHIEERIHRARGRFKEYGVDYLAYAVIDTIVDGYFKVLEKLEERIEELEDEIINEPSPDTISSVQIFRHDLVWFRRRIWTLREVISRLERTDSAFVHHSTHLYIRDVYDHTIKIAEDVDVYREMAEGLMEIYLSKVSNNTNEIMKMLTIIANVFIPLTFIAGVYGMNFEYMPEIYSPWGYPAVLMGMGAVGVIMLGYFRKKGWI
jgi:magnesium transporter